MKSAHDANVTNQFGPRANAYVESVVHSQGQDLIDLAALAEKHAPEHAIDLGSGAGFPGLILALETGIAFDLAEADQRKAAFLREAVRSLGLANAKAVESRIEAVDAPGAFDAITARALATLPLILELGGHLLKPEGALLAMKGVVPADDDVMAQAQAWQRDGLLRELRTIFREQQEIDPISTGWVLSTAAAR